MGPTTPTSSMTKETDTKGKRPGEPNQSDPADQSTQRLREAEQAAMAEVFATIQTQDIPPVPFVGLPVEPLLKSRSDTPGVDPLLGIAAVAALATKRLGDISTLGELVQDVRHLMAPRNAARPDPVRHESVSLSKGGVAQASAEDLDSMPARVTRAARERLVVNPPQAKNRQIHIDAEATPTDSIRRRDELTDIRRQLLTAGNLVDSSKEAQDKQPAPDTGPSRDSAQTRRRQGHTLER